MQIDIDVGNTRYKCRTPSGLSIFDSESALLDFLAGRTGVTRVRIASVKATNLPDQVMAAASIDAAQVFVARTRSELNGLKIGYSDPCSMGVDRWLAMLAAKEHLSEGVVVVDAGSALTVDVVTELGEHSGGYILPGLQLMRSSLFTNTDKVIFDARLPLVGVGLGVSTQSCVDNGVLMAAVGLIDRVVADHPGYKLVMTGGDCATILPYISHPADCLDELVLDGLVLADSEDVLV